VQFEHFTLGKIYLVLCKKQKMKKGALCILMCTLAAGALSAQGLELSAGGGLFFDLGAGWASATALGITTEITDSQTNFGAYGFFDAKYLEAWLGISFVNGGKVKTEITGLPAAEVSLSFTKLAFGLFGKLPFHLGQKFALFPLLGIQYDMMLAAKGDAADVPGFNKEDFNSFWFKAGAGFDVNFTERVYLRFEALFGIGLPNEFEQAMIDNGMKSPVVRPGGSARLAVGYKF
jgi:opacity protein-like surface antigen